MNKIYLEMSARDVVNILGALELYKKLMIPEIYKPFINTQIKEITKQLQLQKIDIYASDDESTYAPGDLMYIDDIHGLRECIIVGAGEKQNFVKAAVVNSDNKLEIIEFPVTLLRKADDNEAS